MTTSIPTHSESSSPGPRFWWQHLTAYHWFVLLVASMAWFFDCLDQRIFSLARIPALSSLMHLPSSDGSVQHFGKIVTAFFLIGWGIGGLLFGALGDRFGRTRMLTVTILIYSIFTGLSFFSRSGWDFTLFRFMTGLGVGGVFGLAVALVAETVPAIARTQALGLLQLLSAVGNISSSFVKMGVDSLGTHGIVANSQTWRYMFLVGAAPALMVIFSAWFLREPEPWLRLKEAGLLPKGNILSSYAKVIGIARWRRNLVIGALIASTGVVGLWAIGEYAPDLQRNLFNTYYSAPFTTKAELEKHAKEIADHVNAAINYAFLLNQIGAVVGMWLFTRIALTWGRKPAFFLGFIAAMVSTVFVYWKMTTPRDAYWMMPLMGAGQLGVFAGFSIYLPELFPSALRSTGTSFCYNLGRFAAAGGSFFSAVLSKGVFAVPGNPTSPLPLRYSAISMCVIFLIGLVTLWFAPETKGQPLPEEETDAPRAGFAVAPVAVK
ncbi:MAG TPA: MFS transporter, partial [Tepidisphaeraceae bacterium]|jgi:MFS family permease|nr:MFS transporter [Tepidisphaeraceae bacterium]